VCSTGTTFSGLLWDFSHPLREEDALGREEEDLEDTVSHLSIYLTGLDALYREQAAQLRQLIHGIEKITQELEEQRTEPQAPSIP
jgi:Lhr-like helicase